MKKIAWSKLIRRTHMYLVLFLSPWVMVFALSSIIFTHFKFFSGGKPLAPFEQVAILSGLATFVLLVLTM